LPETFPLARQVAEDVEGADGEKGFAVKLSCGVDMAAIEPVRCAEGDWCDGVFFALFAASASRMAFMSTLWKS